MKKYVTSLLALFLSLPLAASIFETNAQQRANLAFVDKWTREVSSPVRGLLADEKKGEVLFLGEFCDLGKNAVIEFFIVSETSDRDYESLVRSFAAPGDIIRAVESLGIRRGRNVDYRKMRFWPYGSKVEVSLSPLSPGADPVFRPIQEYVTDMASKSRHGAKSFVYCGSVDDKTSPGRRLCDTEPPGSILSLYNEPLTVIDTPVRASQSSVYERYRNAASHGFEPFGLCIVRIRPAGDEAGGRLADCTLSFVPGNDGVLCDYATGGKAAERLGVSNLVERLSAETKGGADLFATVGFSDEMSLSDAVSAAGVVSHLEGASLVKIKEVPPGSVYHGGFSPNQSWREPGKRPTQPWVLKFNEPADGKLSVEMVKTNEDWSDKESLDPVLTEEKFRASSREEVLSVMEREGHGLPVLLVFAPASMKLGAFMPTVRALLDRHPTVYFFPE